MVFYLILFVGIKFLESGNVIDYLQKCLLDVIDANIFVEFGL